jgi:hypothetical protein
MSLAYGCQGIQYFTYWTPVGRPDFEFGTALIAKDGGPSRQYHDATAINTSYLQPIGRQLKHLLSESVVHANEAPLPAGATTFTPSPQLRSVVGERVLVGQFRTAADDGRRWLFVANRSYAVTDAATVTVTVQPGIGTVEEFTPGDGQYRPVDLAAGAFGASIASGAGRLYRLTPAG